MADDRVGSAYDTGEDMSDGFNRYWNRERTPAEVNEMLQHLAEINKKEPDDD